MGDLQYRLMTATELINGHFSRYEKSPSEKGLKEHIDWARGLDQVALEYALDPRNHPTVGGTVPRPKLPTLMRLAFEGTRQEPKVHPTAEYYQPLDEPPDKCLYCVDGEVSALVWRDKWTVEDVGHCKHCSDGDAECHPGIIAVAKRWDMHCMQVIFKLVLFPLFVAGFGDSKGEKRKVVEVFLDGLLDNPKLKSVEVPDHLKGLPEHEGTEIIAEQPIKAGVPMADGFVPEDNEVPF